MTDFKTMAEELREAGAGRTPGPWEYELGDVALYFNAGTLPSGRTDWQEVASVDSNGQNLIFIAHVGTHADDIATALEEAAELEDDVKLIVKQLADIEKEKIRLAAELTMSIAIMEHAKENATDAAEVAMIATRILLAQQALQEGEQ